MSADLDWELAQTLAGALLTIGHPYSDAAVKATALDLLKWCKGSTLDGREWTPARQAQWLVDEARNWDEGWPDKGGTRKLRNLFLSKFPPQGFQPGNQVVDWANQPCVCGRDKKFKDCCYGKPLFEEPIQIKKSEPDAGIPPAAAVIAPLTAEKFQQALDDERRRKAAQLHRLGLD